MESPSEAKAGRNQDRRPTRNYGGYSDIVDYILGITFEIWEQRQVDRITDYYGDDIDVFSLEGITRGSAGMVSQTRATLDAFPDRLLLGDDVIWSGNLDRGFSSHRITSPMTNRGDTRFGAATGNRVITMNIADCEITEGRITREWLVRDNLALVTQLGFDTATAAAGLARGFDPEFRDWLQQEHERTNAGTAAGTITIGSPESDSSGPWARRLLEACWTGDGQQLLESVYAPYCVVHRAPIRVVSGLGAIIGHYAELRNAFPDATVGIDHVCSQPFNRRGTHIAVRWSVAALHEGPFHGLEASGKPVYVVGVTHWRVLGDRIVAEWTVFDELAMMAQLLDPES